MVKIEILHPGKENKKIDSEIKRQQPKKQPNLPVESKPEIQQETPKDQKPKETQKE